MIQNPKALMPNRPTFEYHEMLLFQKKIYLVLIIFIIIWPSKGFKTGLETLLNHFTAAQVTKPEAGHKDVNLMNIHNQ